MQLKKISMALALALAVPQFSLAADTVVIQEDKSSSVLKGIFYQVWGKLRSLNPSTAKNTKYRVIATAGIRGSETTESVLEPYWKGDQSEDPVFVQSLKLFNKAQQSVEQGNLQAAGQSLDSFIQQYKGTQLYPNALFTKALVSGGQGDKATSIELMRSFINVHPKHPLAEDAQKVIDAQLG
jgi:TolA-binding protein